MTQSRHKHRKSRPLVRRIAPVAAPAALVAGVAGGAIAWPAGDVSQDPEDTGSLTALERPSGQSVSRGADRPTASATDPAPEDDAAGPSVAPTTTPSPEATEEAEAADETAEPAAESEPSAEPTAEPTSEPSPEPTAVDTLFATAGLNVRSGPGTDHEVVTVIERGSEVDVTGESDGRFSQVLVDGDALWASGEYLSDEEPAEDEDESGGGGISQAECSHGSSVESGLTADAIRVHRAVCDRFPDVDSYGGLRSGDGGAHGSGRALDIMVTGSTGDSIAAWLRENYEALGITELIWEQRIWTVQRSSDGWRWMEDRGGATANHYDHVHVTVSGNSGTV